MKKNYQAPLITVLKMRAQQQMLAGSLTESTNSANSVDDGVAGARRGGGDWYEED